jgi:ABC-type branched-subunit amino acid transport system substrate-binding protein
VKLLVSDGLLSSSIAAAGSRRERLFGTFPAARPTASGDQLKSKLRKAEPDTRVAPYTLHAAAAAEVLLDAICRSDGSREDVIAKLPWTELDTAVGPIAFDKNEPKDAGYAVYRAKGVWGRVAVYRARKGVWRRVSRPDARMPMRHRQGWVRCLKPVARHPDSGARSNP